MTDEPNVTPGEQPPSDQSSIQPSGEGTPVPSGHEPPSSLGTGTPGPGEAVKVEFKLGSPVGWLVSGFILLLYIVLAVGNYAQGDEGQADAVQLEQTLKSEVNMGAAKLPLPGVGGEMKKSGQENLRRLVGEAMKLAPKSEKAALVAVVAAREAGDAPPPKAIEKLSQSDASAMRKAAHVFGGDVVTQSDVESFGKEKAEGFALKLAQAQARESLELPSGRAELLDSSYFAKAMVIGVGGLAVAAAGVVCLIVFLANARKWKPVGFGHMVKADGDRYMIRFAGYLIAFTGVQLVAGQLVDALGEKWATPVVMALIGVATLAFLRAPALGRADRAADVVGERRPFWRLVATGLYGYLCTIPLLLVALGLIYLLSQVFPSPSHPLGEDFATAGGLEWLALLLAAAVLAPLTEELAFRGLLLPALATRLRPIASVLLCGFLFAAIHPQGPLIWPALMTTGAAAAYLRYSTGSLVPSIVLHAVHNGVIVAVAFLVG